jgi:ATP-dependent DNA ligase
MELKGVIAKRKDSRDEAGERSGNWQKLNWRQQDFVVGGYRPGGSSGLDALLVGYYENEELRTCGCFPNVWRWNESLRLRLQRDRPGCPLPK